MAHLLIMAGGTGGHIIPALAVARILQEKHISVSWIGARGGLEETLVTDAGIAFDGIDIKGLRQSGLKRKVVMPFMLLHAVYQSWKIFKMRRPGAVLGMGGFVSGPGGIVAGLLGVPIVLHEQNTVAGLTNRWLSKICKLVLTGFPEASGFAKSQWAGNPVRQEIVDIEDPGERLRDRAGPLRVLVIGGSQGAGVFNTHLPGLLGRALPGRYEVHHQCGRSGLQETEAAYEEHGVDAKVSPFISDMAQAYSWSDLVICRSGAMTVSEVCAAGVAALFVPYPYAVNDHQTINANYLVHDDAGYLVTQESFVQGDWMTMLENLNANRPELIETARRARGLARPNAAVRVAGACQEVLNA